MLQGLVAAHAAGVIHRDLKPGNIFLAQSADASRRRASRTPERRERAKILDFGISKLDAAREKSGADAHRASTRRSGSFAYMAPEQVRGAARADERADIYAVGAVAFRALSGRLPFEGTTAAVLVALKLDARRPRSRRPPASGGPPASSASSSAPSSADARTASPPRARRSTAWRSIQPAVTLSAKAALRRGPRPSAR